MPESPVSARLFLVRGRVQGVGYRAFARRAAEELGVTGYAKNLASGDVEVFAQGAPAAVDALGARLALGPRWSDVRGVESSEAAPQRFGGFLVR
ncbi:MAG: acylphosphatase [Acidobacteria bacterium]|nr:acylphosphatase [Acidobacteriota bacterium]